MGGGEGLTLRSAFKREPGAKSMGCWELRLPARAFTLRPSCLDHSHPLPPPPFQAAPSWQVGNCKPPHVTSAGILKQTTLALDGPASSPRLSGSGTAAFLSFNLMILLVLSQLLGMQCSLHPLLTSLLPFIFHRQSLPLPTHHPHPPHPTVNRLHFWFHHCVHLLEDLNWCQQTYKLMFVLAYLAERQNNSWKFLLNCNHGEKIPRALPFTEAYTISKVVFLF